MLLYTKQAQHFQKLRRNQQSTLSAKTRFGRSFGFRSGDLVALTLPEIRYKGSFFGGEVELEQEEHTALLLKRASRQDKIELFRRRGITRIPEPGFFRQHLWVAIVEEEIVLVLEGFMTLLQSRNDGKDKDDGERNPSTNDPEGSELHSEGS